MTNQEKILQAIKPATSQQPIGMLVLIDQLGIDGNTMANELEALYNAKRINRCLHTKDGITQQVVWPTNVIANVQWGQFDIIKPKPAPVPPRQTKQTSDATITKGNTQLKILEAIYATARAEITARQLRKHVDVADIYQYLNWYIDNGYITRQTVTAQNTKTDLISISKKAPETAHALYYLRYPKRNPNANKVTDQTHDLYNETVAAVQQEQEAPQADIFNEEQADKQERLGDYENQTKAYDEFTQALEKSMGHIANEHPLNSQVGGDHYKKLGQYQPWEVLARWLTPDELRGFAKGTVIAYLARERDKGGDADIAKALHTLQLWQALKDTNAPESTP